MKKFILIIPVVLSLILCGCNASVPSDYICGDTRVVVIAGGTLPEIAPIVDKIRSEGWELAAVEQRRFWFKRAK